MSRAPTRRLVLAIGHAGAGFGFGRVLSGILANLPLRFEVQQFELSTHSTGRPGWVVHGNETPGDYFGLQQLGSLIPRLDPDIVFIVHELWCATDYLALVRRCSKARVVAYCPIDGSLRRHPYLLHLGGLDGLALYSKTAKDAFLRGIEEVAGTEAAPAHIPPISIIPHGIDQRRFFPIAPALSSAEMRREARRRLRLPVPDSSDAFIFLNANRNQPRKAVELTVEAFGRFAFGKPPGVRLYLHMGVPDQGVDVIALADRHGVSDRLLFTDRGRSHPRRDDSELNLIFNACQVGVNTSYGEGWGLVAFEHGATGAAQIVPDHSACAELWRDHGVLATTDYPVQQELIVGRRVRVDAVAAAMERLYSDLGFLEERSQRATENAERQLSWCEVGTRFASLFDSLLG